jgi:Tol biopolymer transport system component
MQSSASRFFLLISLFFTAYAHTQSPEHTFLRNIKQITFPSMGFEKAGESYFSPDGKTLLFQAVPTGKEGYQIYSIDLEQGEPRLVSTGKGSCTCAFFRPDGKKIIFASSHEAPVATASDEQKTAGYQRENKNYVWEFTPYMNIYEANPDGSDLKALTQGPAYKAECAYSSDGSYIVFASNSSGSMNLYTMHSDGSGVRQITHTMNGYNGGPFFSPDDSTIIYRADYEKQHYLQIYCIDRFTQNRRQVTMNDVVNWAPFWHPNGEVIVFTTSLHGHHQYELYLLNIETNISHRLTYNGSFDGLASFNKDGTKITWTSKRGPDKTCQIFIADFVMPENLHQ